MLKIRVKSGIWQAASLFVRLTCWESGHGRNHSKFKLTTTPTAAPQEKVQGQSKGLSESSQVKGKSKGNDSVKNIKGEKVKEKAKEKKKRRKKGN